MAVKLSNNRLIFGMTISLLVHFLVFLFLYLLLQFHTTTPTEKKIESLEVRLTQLSPPKVQAKPSKELLTPTAPVQLFHARPSRQDITPTYYQQTIESQFRQRSEQQAQIMILQLQQLLAKRLDVHPVEMGKCMLAESGGGVNHKMVCDSPALYEVLSKDEKIVVEMLMALREMGRMLKGFSAGIRAEKLEIQLIDEE